MIGAKTVYLILVLSPLLGSCNARGPGCTDPQANNMEPSSTVNDGSCSYDPVWMRPVRSQLLSDRVSSTSGLIYWDGLLWTHNDNDDTRLYGIDTASGEITRELLLPEVLNTDWEDIAEDGEYIYVGDFGNNASGNRTDLHILRIDMSSLKSGFPAIDTIWFSYSDQPEPVQAEVNQTDFDCEAMVASSGNIYLFSKQWIKGETSLYVLPKQPGTFVAQKRANFNIQGLVTGATLMESERLLVLCGYTGILTPFIYLFYDYPDDDFFSGNTRLVNLSIPFLQVEGITTRDGLIFYLSNESFVLQPATNTPQQLHRFDLSNLLGEYLEGPGN